MGGPPAWGLGEGLITPRGKETACYEMLHCASACTCEQGNVLPASIKGREFLD